MKKTKTYTLEIMTSSFCISVLGGEPVKQAYDSWARGDKYIGQFQVSGFEDTARKDPLHIAIDPEMVIGCTLVVT